MVAIFIKVSPISSLEPDFGMTPLPNFSSASNPSFFDKKKSEVLSPLFALSKTDCGKAPLIIEKRERNFDIFSLKSVKPQSELHQSNDEPSKMIGNLTAKERKEKIEKYQEKRKHRIWNKKTSYDCRKKVADKRLRIKGRFVTREQAFEILGTNAKDILKNEYLMELIKSKSDCSIVTSAQQMKIRNIQALIEPEIYNKSKSGLNKKELKAKHFKQEIQITGKEVSSSSIKERLYELPFIKNPIFSYKRIPKKNSKIDYLKDCEISQNFHP